MGRSAKRRQASDRDPPAPRHVAGIIAQLMARRGYNQLQLSEARQAVWLQLVGERLSDETRPGNVARGVWEITVKNSVVLQELAFRKAEFVKRLRELAPDEKITDLRFRVGAIDQTR